MLFENRADATEKLAIALERYRGDNPLILGIPRGAVPMARVIAERLCGESDVVLVRKLEVLDADLVGQGEPVRLDDVRHPLFPLGLGGRPDTSIAARSRTEY